MKVTKCFLAMGTSYSKQILLVRFFAIWQKWDWKILVNGTIV